MAWNGSGTFSLLYSWVARRDAGSPTNLIGATEMDAEFANIKSGLENCVTRDGQNAATAALPMGGYNHTSVGAATARTQYARVTEAQDGTLWKAASPGGNIDAMTGTLAPAITAYAANMIVTIIAPGSGSNTVTNPTINLNSIGAKTIKKHQGALVAGDYTAGDLLVLVYDGTYFELLNPKYSSVDAIPAHSTFTAESGGGDAADYVPVVDTSATSADRKTLVTDFLKNALASITAKTAPVAADTVMIGDSAASDAVKRSTWTEVFTGLLAGFTAKSVPILADTTNIADSAASGVPKASTLQQIFNALSTTTAKTSLASGDKVFMGDSAASDVAKHITWTNLKTQLTTDLAANQTEVEDASSTKFLTPGNAKYHDGVAKAWCVGNAWYSTGTPDVDDSYNVSSITDQASGIGRVNITTAFSSSQYAVSIIAQRDSTNSALWGGIHYAEGPSSSACMIAFMTDGAAYRDPNKHSVVFHGDQ